MIQRKIGNWNFAFYNTRKHKPGMYVPAELRGRSLDEVRSFAESEVDACLLMITTRLQNFVFNSTIKNNNIEFILTRLIFEFINKNIFKIVRTLFYVGYVEIYFYDDNFYFWDDLARFNILEQRARRIIYLDSYYKVAGKTQAEVLRPQIDLINVVNDSDLNLLLNYGAMGIISPENSSSADGFLNDKERKELEDEYYRNYGIRFGRWSLLISRQPLKFIPITLPIAELQFVEKKKQAIASVLQFLNIPKELHAYFESAKYSNRNEAELDMYSNCVSSWANCFIELIKKMYFAAIKDNEINYPQNIEFYYDIVGVAALQEAQYNEKLKVNEEIVMWRNLLSLPGIDKDLINKRLNDLIEEL